MEYADDKFVKWYATVKMDRPIMNSLELFRNWMKMNFKEGSKVVVVVYKYKQITTWPQYKYLYGVLIPLLADYIGEDTEYIEKQIKNTWHYKIDNMTNFETGETEKVKTLLSFSMTQISREKFRTVINNVVALCHELELNLPQQRNFDNFPYDRNEREQHEMFDGGE